MMDAPMLMPKEMNINDLDTVLLDQLKAAGWSVEIETDYPDDFKEYYASKRLLDEEIFPRLTVLLLTQNSDPQNFDVRFIYYANPAQIKPNKRAFARNLRTQHIPKLQELSDALLRKCNVITRREEITIDARAKYKLKFDDGPAVSPAYAIQIHYWKQPLLAAL